MLTERTATKGQHVRFWTGLREGLGRTGTLSYDGIHYLGGTPCVYIRSDEPRCVIDGKPNYSVGAVALSHVDEIPDQPLSTS
jgi:hypothetical protein